MTIKPKGEQMKFTAGYILGATTVVGLGASFVGGVFGYAWLNSKKNEKAKEIQDEDLIMAGLEKIFNQKKEG